MEWHKFSPHFEPAQGLKIIWFSRGDCYIAQRFIYKNKSYYLPIPYTDSRFATSDSPEYWCYIDFPQGYEGRMEVLMEGDEKVITIDEMYERFPDEHNDFVELMIQTLGGPFRTKKKTRK